MAQLFRGFQYLLARIASHTLYTKPKGTQILAPCNMKPVRLIKSVQRLSYKEDFEVCCFKNMQGLPRILIRVHKYLLIII